MPLVAINPDDRITYYLSGDTDKEVPFFIRMLPRKTFARLTLELYKFEIFRSDAQDFANEVLLEAIDSIQDVLREGLVGWGDGLMKFEDGKLVKAEFEADDDGRPAERSLNHLHIEWAAELAMAILNAQQPAEEDKGKS